MTANPRTRAPPLGLVGLHQDERAVARPGPPPSMALARISSISRLARQAHARSSTTAKKLFRVRDGIHDCEPADKPIFEPLVDHVVRERDAESSMLSLHESRINVVQVGEDPPSRGRE